MKQRNPVQKLVVELKMSDAVSGKIVHEKVLSTANNPFPPIWERSSRNISDLSCRRGNVVLLTVYPEW